MRTFGTLCSLLVLAASACSAPTHHGDDDDSSGGSSAGTVGSGGTGGSAGSSGSSGAAGTTTMPIPGGPHPFPQNEVPGACRITSVANASAAVASAYTYWKGQFVVPAGAALRVSRLTNNGDTVSEGIAYGMLLAVYMNDRPTFDGVWAFAKAHLDGFGLMNWHLNADGSIASDGTGSATDADEDMAWSLIMASAQWQSGTYLDDAKKIINAMYTYEIGPDGLLVPGDNWGKGSNRTFPDYFSPAYFRVFADVTGNSTWRTTIIDRNYAILKDVSGTYGLVPDSTTTTYQHMGGYGYDACRTPWRIAMDYCFNGEPRALEYLNLIAPFFDSQGVANIGDGYSLDGQKTSTFGNMAFIGPAGVAGMAAGSQKLLDDAFTYGATGTGGNNQYYQQSLRAITMLMMSGNLLDYTKP